MLMMQNGQLVDEGEASISVLDHGLLYGVGAFETLRIYEGHPFLIEDHIARLGQACREMQIQIPYSSEEWEKHIQELLMANHLSDAVIRLTVTGGVKDLGLQDTTYNAPNLLLYTRTLPRRVEGKRLQVLSTPRKAPGGVEAFKTNNYLNNVVARQEIANYPITEGLFLTAQGYVAEGITSNIFFVKRESIYTPSTDQELLPGITRALTIKLLSNLGFNVYEGNYTISDFKGADEIFLTNSVQEIVPVLELEEVRMTEKRPVMDCLMKKYQEYTSRLRSVRNVKGGD